MAAIYIIFISQLSVIKYRVILQIFDISIIIIMNIGYINHKKV